MIIAEFVQDGETVGLEKFESLDTAIKRIRSLVVLYSYTELYFWICDANDKLSVKIIGNQLIVQ